VAKAKQQLTAFGQCQGKLGKSAGQLKQCLDAYADVYKRVARLYTYAMTTNDEDKSANTGIELAQRAASLYSEFQSASAFVSPELLALGEKKVAALIKADKGLAVYRPMLNNTLRMAPHTLDRAGEELIAAYGASANTASSLYGTLSNADMPWPKLKLGEQEVTIDQAAYTKYRAVDDRAQRKQVFDAFWGKWKEFERTFGTTLYEQLKRDSIDAKVRRYPDSLTAALNANKLPRSVYDTLVTQARANLPTLHRYFRLRADMLGVKEMRYYDIYPPLVSSKRKYGIDESVRHMLASVPAFIAAT
jgi:oligoendopeptidase F